MEVPFGKKSARHKMMDYLAQRNHSEYELQQKLRRCEYTAEEIEEALSEARGRMWMPDPQELSAHLARELHRKRKSHFYILQHLQQKRLPSIEKDAEMELKKARSLIEGRFSGLSKPSAEDKKKMAQFLKNRGFDYDTIARIIHNDEA